MSSLNQPTTTPLSSPPSAANVNIRWSDYAQVGAILTAVSLGLFVATRLPAEPAPRPEQLLGPIFALALLTAVIWLGMTVVRNWLVMRGLSDASYFIAYDTKPPAEWSERPTRVFNNLTQLPPLFYVVCTLMIVTHSLDRAQLVCAWIYVALRAVHACVYIGWNYLPYRFAAWAASTITLGVLWFRFAAQTWPGF